MNDRKKETNSPFQRLQNAEKSNRKKEIQKLTDLKEKAHSEFCSLNNIMQENECGQRIVTRMRLLREQIRDLKRGGTAKDALRRRALPWKEEKELIVKGKHFKE